MLGPLSDKRRSEYGGSWFPVLIIIFLIFLLGLTCSKKKEGLIEAKKAERKTKAPAINVVTMPVAPGTVRDWINLPGSLEANIELVVSTEVAGMILEKSVSEGALVKKGTLLGAIDSSKYLNSYNAAKASYESALKTKNRLEKLYQSELTNKSELDRVVAEMENHRSAMQIAAIDLEKCRILAPIDGIVNRIYIEKGQFVDKGIPFVEIIQTDPIKVNVGIPESDVTAVMSIDRFNVVVDALGGKVFEARKKHLSRTTSSQARVYNLELIIDNANGELLPDMFVRVEIVKKTVENALAVPLYSVISINNSQRVYVARKNPKHEILQAALDYLGIDMEAPLDTAFACEVKTGIQDGWMVEITEGIKPGDQVITVGQRSVSDGQRIRIIRTQKEQEVLVR